MIDREYFKKKFVFPCNNKSPRRHWALHFWPLQSAMRSQLLLLTSHLVNLNRHVGPKVLENPYLIKRAWVSLFVGRYNMYPLRHPLKIIFCHVCICGAIYDHLVWNKVVVMQMWCELFHICYFAFFLVELLPLGQIQPPVLTKKLQLSLRNQGHKGRVLPTSTKNW